MRRQVLTVLAAAGISVFWSMGGLAETTAPGGDSGMAPAPAAASPAPDPAVPPEGVTAEMMSQGEELFYKNCRRCHGMRGTAGVPLKGNENIADAYYLVSMILNGRGYMPALGEHLTDDQIALISTFARNSWGNAYGVVTPEDVKDMR